jgi:hypothetical protein
MRKIVVDGIQYRYRIGKCNTLILGEGIKMVASDNDLMPGEDIERAKWKNYFHITPSLIETYIRSHSK